MYCGEGEEFDWNLDKFTLFIVKKWQGDFKVEIEELPTFKNKTLLCFSSRKKVHFFVLARANSMKINMKVKIA